MLNAPKSECLSESSFMDLRRSLCILPAAEKTRSTPADEAGAARYYLAILASAGHLRSDSLRRSISTSVFAVSYVFQLLYFNFLW